MKIKKVLIFDLAIFACKKILELTSYCKFKVKEPKRKKIDYVRPSLPSFTGAKKKSVAVRGGRRFPKTQKCSK